MSDFYLHVHSTEAIPPEFGAFRSFSPGWQTAVGQDESIKNARRISKRTGFPCLFVWDRSDTIEITLYLNGKIVANFGPGDMAFLSGMALGNKGTTRVPEAMGFPEVGKKRLSTILTAPTLKEVIEMLEEYFGVCLIPSREEMERNPEALFRARGEEKFRAYCLREKACAKKSDLRLKLIREMPGKLFTASFGGDYLHPHRHCFLYGYQKPGDTGKTMVNVIFENGELKPIDEERFQTEPRKDIVGWFNDMKELVKEKENWPRCISFTDRAPEPFRNKPYILPSGYVVGEFLDENRILLESRSGIAVMNAEGQILGKFGLKGLLYDRNGMYFLTTGATSWIYAYDPASFVRIYHLTDEKSD